MIPLGVVSLHADTIQSVLALSEYVGTYPIDKKMVTPNCRFIHKYSEIIAQCRSLGKDAPELLLFEELQIFSDMSRSVKSFYKPTVSGSL